MPDDTPSLDVKATLDASGVVSGAQQAGQAVQQGFIGPMTEAEATAKKFGVSIDVAQGALDKLKAQQKAAEIAALTQALQGTSRANEEVASTSKQAATAEEEQAEQAEKLNAMMREHQQQLMRNAFYVHRLAEGFKDISMGGRLAGQGVMDVSESLQYMLGPELAIYAAIAQVVAMLGVAATMHHRVAGEAKEHADAEKSAADQIKEAWTTANDVFKTSMDEISKNKSFDSLLTKAKEFTGELHIQENAANSLQAALDRLEDATFGAKESGLNLAEQQALQGKTGDAAESIRSDFGRQRDEMRAQHETEKAQRELAKKNTELAQLQSEKAAIQAQLNASTSDISNVAKTGSSGVTGASLGQSDYEYARDRSNALRKQQRDSADGYADSEGKAVPSLTDSQATELFSLAHSLEALRQKEVTNGPQYSDQIERLKKDRESLESRAGKDLAGAQSATYDTAPGQTQAQARQQAYDALSAQYDEKFKELDGKIEAFQKTHTGQETTDKAIEAAQKNLTEATAKLAELEGRIAVTKVDIQAAGINVSASQVGGQVTGQKDANSAQNLYSKQVEDNFKELFRKNLEKQKIDAAAGEAPLSANLERDREAVTSYQQNMVRLADHAREMGAVGKKHAEQTKQLADAMKSQLDELRAAVAADEQALRQFKQSQKTNAQQ